MGTFVENVNIAANSITQGLIDNAEMLAPHTTEIDLVANDIASVVISADNMASINAVAAQVVPNIAEILLADDNSAMVSALYDLFDDRFLGAKAVAPTLDNDGDALIEGAIYWDLVSKQMMAYDATNLVWIPAVSMNSNTVATFTNKTLDDISNKIGANHIHHECRNVSGIAIPKGTIVTAQGSQSGTDYVEIVPVTDATTQVALGITHTSINNNGTGLVMNTGVCSDVTDTNLWNVGTILYPNNSGGLTSTKTATVQYQACAVVLRKHSTQGVLLIEFTEPKLYGTSSVAGYVKVDATPTDGSLNAVSSNGVFDALAGKQGTLTIDSTPTDGSINPIQSNAVFDGLALKADVSSLTSYLAKSGGIMTGAITAIAETKVAMGANDIALASGNVFTKTISGATTLTVSGWLASGNANSFILELTNGGSAVVTYPAGVKWASGTAPTLTASGVDILGFYSHDGGTTVRGIVLAKDSK